jgi:hypothetical protein
MSRGKLRGLLFLKFQGNCGRWGMGLGVKITVCGVPKPAKRAWSFSPWRASRGSTRPSRYSLSPVGAPSGHADIALTGLKIFWFRPTLPRLARHGLNDHATSWRNTLCGPAFLIEACVTGFRVPRIVILTPMRMRGSTHKARLRLCPSPGLLPFDFCALPFDLFLWRW